MSIYTLRITSDGAGTAGSSVLPAAQARARFSGRGRRPRSEKTAWFHLVRWRAMQEAPPRPLDGPLELEVLFLFERPKSLPKGQALKWTKPDFDNLEKAVADALTRAGWWADDGRVARSSCEKRYAGPGQPAGAVITVTELADPGWKRGAAR